MYTIKEKRPLPMYDFKEKDKRSLCHKNKLSRKMEKIRNIGKILKK